MKLNERGDRELIFVGEGPSLPKHEIEEGDEVTLYYEGRLVMAMINSINNKQYLGTITRSTFDHDLHMDLTTGKEICFSEQNIFGVSKDKNAPK